MKFIWDEASAERVGDRELKLYPKPLGKTVYTYRHRCGATAFGVEVRFINADGAKQTENIHFQ